ncbi:MAG: eukaryotic-like serine/threonine-protein kinase [Acidobacteriota bacterium]|jgi:serine/threonine-protein kinase|nr:eukaryotic-like serine/threonine-protein kinase [Acidobacteriota bacterium]
MSLSPGTRLGPYEILGLLAVGGMGEVYRASDSRLDRLVAIKVLPERLACEAEALARFEREAKAVAALSHPNILAIFDFVNGGKGDGLCYAVTELLEGKTLRGVLQAGPLSLRKAVDYARQIAQGLAAAHVRGIVHRDLKPENLFVVQGEQIKILDFGLVRHVDMPDPEVTALPTLVRPTEPGKVMGTVGYMSPEQVRGIPADPRSDIFSFGAVLYEMLMGERAFHYPTAAETMTAILKEDPPRLTEIARLLPPGLDRLLRHCLEKEPHQRFQSARDLAFALEGVETESTRSSSEWIDLTSSRRAEALPPSIAVLPFRNLSPEKETEYFSDGITEEILNALSRIPDLRVAARTSSFAFKGRNEDIRNIGRQLNAQVVLEGSVRQAGGRIRVTAQLIDVTDGYHLWSERYDRKIDDVFAVQDEISRAIAETLEVRLRRQEDEPLVRPPTRDIEAYNLYLKGLFFFNQRALGPAIEQFQKAIARDPSFAAPYTGLADSYIHAGFYGSIAPLDAWRGAQAAAHKARELEPDSASVHLSLGLIDHFYGWDIPRAEREFRRAIEISPRFAEAYTFLGQLLAFSGRFGEGIEIGEMAVELDPLSIGALTRLGYSLTWAGRYEEAIRICLKALEIQPGAMHPLTCIALTYLYDGQPAKAIAAAEQSVEATRRLPGYPLAQLGEIYAFTGRTEDARRILAEMHERSASEYVAPQCFSMVYGALGDREATLHWIERSIEEHNAFFWALPHSPRFRQLRSDPRFAAVVEKIRARDSG